MSLSGVKFLLILCWYHEVLLLPVDSYSFDSDKIKEDDVPSSLQFKQMNIETTIRDNYAKTRLMIKATNKAKCYQEGNFSLVIPPNDAFINRLSMQAGFTYEGRVKINQEAIELFEEAKIDKKNVALLRKYNDNLNGNYMLSFNIEPTSESAFFISYEETLQKNSEGYQIDCNIDQKQNVDNIKLEVNIRGNSPIKYVKTSFPQSELLNPSHEFPKVQRIDSTKVTITWELNKSVIKKLTKEDGNILTINYDLEEDFRPRFSMERDSEAHEDKLKEYNEIQRRIRNSNGNDPDDAILEDIKRHSFITDITSLATQDPHQAQIINHGFYSEIGYASVPRSVLEYRLRSHHIPR